MQSRILAAGLAAAAVAAAAATTAWAAEPDGTPDPGFGDGGAVLRGPADPDDPGASAGFGALAPLAGGGVVLVGAPREDPADRFRTLARVTKLTATGALDPTFAGDGEADVVLEDDSDFGASVQAVTAAADGGFLLVGNSDSPDGSRRHVAHVGADGVVDRRTVSEPVGCDELDARRRGDGVVVVVQAPCLSRDDGADYVLSAVAPDGADAFAERPVVVPGGNPTLGTTRIGVGPGARVAVGIYGFGGAERAIVVAHQADGALAEPFGPGGAAMLAAPRFGGTFIELLAVDPDGGVAAYVREVHDEGEGSGRLHRLGPDGAPRTAFGGDGVLDLPAEADPEEQGVTDLLVDADGRLLLATDAGRLTRLRTDGTLDPAFGTGGSIRIGPDDPLVRTRVRQIAADVLDRPLLGLQVEGFSARRAPIPVTEVPSYGVARVLRAGFTPPPTPSPDPATTPVPGTPPGPSATPTPPPARSCASRRRFDIALRPGKRLKVVRARVRVDGKRVPVRRRGGRLVARLDFRGRPPSTVRVVADVDAADGFTYRDKRRYKLCAGKELSVLTGKAPRIGRWR